MQVSHVEKNMVEQSSTVPNSQSIRSRLLYLKWSWHGKVMVIVVSFNSHQNKQRNNNHLIGLHVSKICVDQ